MKERKFELITDFKPSGDQPQAIERLTEGIKKGYREQTLLGVTGSGKTFTMANSIIHFLYKIKVFERNIYNLPLSVYFTSKLCYNIYI